MQRTPTCIQRAVKPARVKVHVRKALDAVQVNVLRCLSHFVEVDLVPKGPWMARLLATLVRDEFTTAHGLWVCAVMAPGFAMLVAHDRFFRVTMAAQVIRPVAVRGVEMVVWVRGVGLQRQHEGSTGSARGPHHTVHYTRGGFG